MKTINYKHAFTLLFTYSRRHVLFANEITIQTEKALLTKNKISLILACNIIDRSLAAHPLRSMAFYCLFTSYLGLNGNSPNDRFHTELLSVTTSTGTVTT